MAFQYSVNFYQVRQTPNYLQFDEFQFVLALLPIYVGFSGRTVAAFPGSGGTASMNRSGDTQ